MSDLHFDPMADPRLVDQLAAAEPELWSAVLDSSSDRSVGRYGRDSNWMLLRSALQHMAETLPKPAFVLMSGDFLAHDFRREFDAAAKDHSDAAFRIFVQKTMQFLAQQLEQVARAMLSARGFRKVTHNAVDTGAAEYDVTAEWRGSGRAYRRVLPVERFGVMSPRVS